MYERAVLDVAEAISAVEAMLEAAPRESRSPLALTVVNDKGDLLAFALMDGGTPMARDYAIKKAYTSSWMRCDISEFAQRRVQQGRSVADYGDPNLVGAARGGLVILDSNSGQVLGAIGVSGGAPEEDEAVARVGLASLGLASE